METVRDKPQAKRNRIVRTAQAIGGIFSSLREARKESSEDILRPKGIRNYDEAVIPLFDPHRLGATAVLDNRIFRATYDESSEPLDPEKHGTIAGAWLAELREGLQDPSDQ